MSSRRAAPGEGVRDVLDTSITSTRLIRVLEQLNANRGLPQVLRTDNGPEFLGEAFRAVGQTRRHGCVPADHFTALVA